MENNLYHSKSGDKILKEFSSHLGGLSSDEAKSRLEKFGFNEIPEKKAIHPVFIFLKQFHSWLVYILIGAAIFSFFTDHMFDVYIILAVLLF
ncbi:MAG: cation-transporting P-type ATPase, partial [Patescibacteria group bacterium]|nr:cation-transporting P-type ATPase [Patescibacteria group bacterium]